MGWLTADALSQNSTFQPKNISLFIIYSSLVCFPVFMCYVHIFFYGCPNTPLPPAWFITGKASTTVCALGGWRQRHEAGRQKASPKLENHINIFLQRVKKRIWSEGTAAGGKVSISSLLPARTNKMTAKQNGTKLIRGIVRSSSRKSS